MDLTIDKTKKKVIKKAARKIKKGKYKFYPGNGSKKSVLMMPKEFIQDLADIEKTIKHQMTWIRVDGVEVNPGWRIKIFGQMAEVVHKLVTAGVYGFRIKKAALTANNFTTKDDFEVPYYDLIVKEIERVR